ncbi:MAG: 50S ribosomal protein L25 [Flavobacteriales bacterium]|nr:50S ribosomal protein L25 [Flavobacteriales bacterium]
MKQVSLSGSPRESVGRKGAEELRKSGRIPGVIYGGANQVAFSVLKNDWDKIVSRPDTLQINIEVGGKTFPTIIQEMQMNPVTDRVTHIDLLELVPGKAVRTTLPVRTTGTSEGVRSGGRLLQNYRKVRISGKPEFIPDDIQLDITDLKIGDMIRVRDIKIEGCTVLEAEASAVVTVQMTRAAMADAAAADAADKKK